MKRGAGKVVQAAIDLEAWVATSDIETLSRTFVSVDAAVYDCLMDAVLEYKGQSQIPAKAKSSSGWRAQPATDRQRYYLSRLGLWRDGMTKSEAGRAIGRHKNPDRVARESQRQANAMDADYQRRVDDEIMADAAVKSGNPGNTDCPW